MAPIAIGCAGVAAGFLAHLVVKYGIGGALDALINKKFSEMLSDENLAQPSDAPSSKTSMDMQRKIHEIEQVVASNVTPAEFKAMKDDLRLGLQKIMRAHEIGALAALDTPAKQAEFLRQNVPGIRNIRMA